MACSSCNKRKKTDLAYVTQIARDLVKIEKIDYRVFKTYIPGVGWAYDCEAAKLNPNRDTIEIIRFLDNTSGEVLSDNAKPKPKPSVKRKPESKKTDEPVVKKQEVDTASIGDNIESMA